MKRNSFLEKITWIPAKFYNKYLQGKENLIKINLNPIGRKESFYFLVNNEREISSLSAQLRCFGIREPNNIKHYLKFIEEDDILLDVGSHFGFFSVLGKNAKRIIGIEPVKSCFKILEENLKINGLKEKTKIFNVALGNGEDIFIKEEGSSNLSQISKEKQGVKIRSYKLDFFTEDYNVNCMKIDVEGYEYEIFMNQEIPKKMNKITMEFHRDLMGLEKSKELIKRFYKQGFKVKYLVEELPLRFYPFMKWKWLFNKLTYSLKDLELEDTLKEIKKRRGLKYLYLIRK